ncbi:1-acyl-sn-glycerol-3-phosphate acyltransferase [Ascidiimonas sp. W6]|uniref:1-acyl-sn-glycerol-3-phosphate acyltransferase n=1 Tax=Ascidiimonas meishanensis TaxID=3128903 RepID=UPI0030EDC90D
MHWISKIIFYKILRWKIEGEFPDVKKMVIIVVPHTSWHDFYIGVLLRAIKKIEINFIGKKEIFRWPFGAYFRWMGGAPIDRTSGQDKVKAIAAIFKNREVFRLSLAPEGTRKKVDQWKTGFYYIAIEAEVPIVMVAFDFGTKTVKISEAFYPTDDKEKDFTFMKSFFKGVIGKVPEYSWEESIS